MQTNPYNLILYCKLNYSPIKKKKKNYKKQVPRYKSSKKQNFKLCYSSGCKIQKLIFIGIKYFWYD